MKHFIKNAQAVPERRDSEGTCLNAIDVEKLGNFECVTLSLITQCKCIDDNS